MLCVARVALNNQCLDKEMWDQTGAESEPADTGQRQESWWWNHCAMLKASAWLHCNVIQSYTYRNSSINWSLWKSCELMLGESETPLSWQLDARNWSSKCWGEDFIACFKWADQGLLFLSMGRVLRNLRIYIHKHGTRNGFTDLIYLVICGQKFLYQALEWSGVML